MTDEEIERLIREITGQIEALPDEPETGKERVRQAVLRLRIEALKKIQAAKESGSVTQETRAGFDYTLLTHYGERPLLYNFLKATHFPWGI